MIQNVTVGRSAAVGQPGALPQAQHLTGRGVVRLKGRWGPQGEAGRAVREVQRPGTCLGRRAGGARRPGGFCVREGAQGLALRPASAAARQG